MSTLRGNGKGPAVAPPDQGRAVRPRARPEAEYVVAAPAGLWTGPRALEAQVDAVTREFGPHVYDGLMLWDDVVSSSLDVLLRGALQNGVTIHPAVEDQDEPEYQAAKDLAEWCETQLDGLPRPLDDWLYEMGQKALAGGNAVAEQTYRDEGPEWVLDRINTKPRDSALWVVDRFSNTLGILPAGPGNPNYWGPGYLPAGPEDRPRWLPLDKFCTLTWDGADNDPRGRPLLRRAFPPWKDKLKAGQDLLKNLSQFGSPSLIGTTAEQSDALPVTDAAGNATPDQPAMSPEQALLNALLAFQNGSALVLPFGASVTALQVLNAGGSFLKAIDSYNNAIAQAVLGASRTVMQAKFGSRADSETAQDVTGLMVRYLQGWLGRMLTKQVLAPLVRYNRGADVAARLCPVASLAPVEHQDWSAVAGAAAQLYPLLQPSQLPWLWEKLGAPPPTESPEEMAGQGQGGGPSEDSEDSEDDAGGADDANVDDDVNDTAAFAAPVSLAGVDLGDMTREDLLALLVDAALANLEGEAAFAFDPNEPRDALGKWVAEGGSYGVPGALPWEERQALRDKVRAAAEGARLSNLESPWGQLWGDYVRGEDGTYKASGRMTEAYDALEEGGPAAPALDALAAVRGPALAYWTRGAEMLEAAEDVDSAAYRKALAKGVAAFDRKADAYAAALEAWEPARAELAGLRAAEPPPLTPDAYPPEPQEPDPVQPEDYPDEPEEGGPDHAVWEREVARLDAADDKAQAAWKKEHARWERAVNKLEEDWEEGHDRWQKDLERAGKKTERLWGAVEREFGDLEEVVTDLDERLIAASDEAVDDRLADLDEEDKDDPRPAEDEEEDDAEPEEEEDDPDAAFAFDPNQPRDNAGRWTRGGGGMPHAQRQAGREQAREHVRAFVARKGPVAQREAEALAGHLATLTVDQLHALKREHGLKASAPNKAALVAKLAERFRQAREDRPPGQAPDPATPAGRREAVKRAIGEVFNRDNGTHPLMQDIAARNETLEGALRDAARHGLIDHGTLDPNADVMRLNEDRAGAWVTGVFEKVYGQKAGGTKAEPKQEAKPEPSPAPPVPTPPAPPPATAPAFDPVAHHEALRGLIERHGRGHGFTHLADVRQGLAERGVTSRARQDEVINSARRAGLVTGSGGEGRYGLDARDKAALIDEGPDSPAILYLSNRPPAGAAPPATPAPAATPPAPPPATLAPAPPAAPERIAPGTYGPTQAKLGPYTDAARADRAAAGLLGPGKTHRDLLSCVGAPHTATCEVRWTTQEDGSTVAQVSFAGTAADGSGYDGTRFLTRAPDGTVSIQNDFFRSANPGGGIGLEMFGRQVENATLNGVSHIETDAAGQFVPGPDPNRSYASLNGYYTWPRFGYDAKVPAASYRRLPRDLKVRVDAAGGNVRGLMSDDKGRKWWLRHGQVLPGARFDLTPGSYSQRTLAAYIAERAARAASPGTSTFAAFATGATPMDPEHYEQPPELSEEDLRILDAVNDRVAREMQAEAPAAPTEPPPPP